MKVEVKGKEYRFEVNGTIGLMYKAELLLGTEKFDHKNKYHHAVLLYAAFHHSNKQLPEIPDLDDFICTLTSEKFNTLFNYFWMRWSELEPKQDEDGGQAQGEGSAPANAIGE